MDQTAPYAGVERLGARGADALTALGLAQPRELLALDGDAVVRATPHRRTLRVQQGDFAGYLKRYDPGAGRIGKIARSRAPAEVEWDALGRAAALGLPVPEALAAVWAASGDREPSALLLRAVPGGERLDELLAIGDLAPAERRHLLEDELVPLVRHLHHAGLQHRDLYACHLLRDARTGRLVLIDLARLRGQARLSVRRRVKDLAALAFSLDGIVRRSELLRLLGLYLRGEGAGLREQRRLAERVVRKARRIARHRPRYDAPRA